MPGRSHRPPYHKRDDLVRQKSDGTGYNPKEGSMLRDHERNVWNSKKASEPRKP